MQPLEMIERLHMSVGSQSSVCVITEPVHSLMDWPPPEHGRIRALGCQIMSRSRETARNIGMWLTQLPTRAESMGGQHQWQPVNTADSAPTAEKGGGCDATCFSWNTPIVRVQTCMILCLIVICVMSFLVLLPPYMSGTHSDGSARRGASDVATFPAAHCADFGRYDV